MGIFAEPKIVIEQRVNQSRSWEEILSDGMVAREKRDNCQWELGDLALEVGKDYGEDSIGKFAGEIGVVKKTLMNYRTVSARFPISTREKYRKLSFSHFTVAAALEQPEAWLEKADDNDWSIEKMRTELSDALSGVKPAKLTDEPPEVYKCQECGLWRLKDQSSFDVCRGHYHINHEKQKYEYS